MRLPIVGGPSLVDLQEAVKSGMPVSFTFDGIVKSQSFLIAKVNPWEGKQSSLCRLVAFQPVNSRKGNLLLCVDFNVDTRMGLGFLLKNQPLQVFKQHRASK